MLSWGGRKVQRGKEAFTANNQAWGGTLSRVLGSHGIKGARQAGKGAAEERACEGEDGCGPGWGRWGHKDMAKEGRQDKDVG